MQFSTFALALALSASLVLSQPIALEPTEYYDGLEPRDFKGLEARDIESSLEAREPILGFGKKEPKVDYQVRLPLPAPEMPFSISIVFPGINSY